MWLLFKKNCAKSVQLMKYEFSNLTRGKLRALTSDSASNKPPLRTCLLVADVVRVNLAVLGQRLDITIIAAIGDVIRGRGTLPQRNSKENKRCQLYSEHLRIHRTREAAETVDCKGKSGQTVDPERGKGVQAPGDIASGPREARPV
ncbi:hypothetical protein CHU98_g9110 [Xylaria longipes]|nr:hypothetical protein CHU98_g9110 [Xylaria longipes]